MAAARQEGSLCIDEVERNYQVAATRCRVLASRVALYANGVTMVVSGEFPNGIRLHGPLGWLSWLGLHIVYLMGFRNRANVLVNWAWNSVTYDRASRLLADSSLAVRAGGR